MFMRNCVLCIIDRVLRKIEYLWNGGLLNIFENVMWYIKVVFIPNSDTIKYLNFVY